MSNRVHREGRRAGTLIDMPIQRDTTDERQARLDKMIEEFRDAQKRVLLNRGIALWTRTERELVRPGDPWPA
jgi:hypothetical protein